MKITNNLFLLLYFLISTIALKAQSCYWGDNAISEKVASLTTEVNYLDSFYVLSANLKITGKEKIYLQKNPKFKDFFSRQNFEMSDNDATLFLSKIVMNRLMIWAPDEKNTLYEPLYDSNGNRIITTSKMIGLKPMESVSINMKLNNIYPLELGYYSLYARIKVKFRDKWLYVYSNVLNFEVDKLPPKSANFRY